MNEEYNSNMDPVSLDNRQTQLTRKVEQLSEMGSTDSPSSPYDRNESIRSVQSVPEVHTVQAVRTEAEGTEEQARSDISDMGGVTNAQNAQNMPNMQNIPRVNIDKPAADIPQTNAAAMNRAVSNPYTGGVSVNDYTNGMTPPKQGLSGGLKAYLAVIIGLCIIFVGMFVFECARAYRENGIFGGDLDRFLDSDNLFDFDDPYDFDIPYDFDSELPFGKIDPDTDSQPDDSEDVQPSDTDTVSEIKAAPSEDGLLTSDVDRIKAKDQPSDIDSANYSARTAFRKVENSVVNVVTYNSSIGDEDDKTGSGSGIILTEDGYIATNSHVVNDSRNTLTEVILNNGKSYIAKIVGIDVRTDLAVLKIDEKGLTPAEFVNSDQIEVGQDAIAVGSPGGMKYSNSLTRGCVSALNRTVKSNALVPYIQTDAAINPGNSGGPLLNSAGQVMGINTIKIANSDYEGMGFAIPTNTVLSIVRDIMKQGYVSGRVRIGISGVTVSSLTAPAGSPSGVRVVGITDDSPLLNTKLQVDDIITAVNGEKIDGMSALFSELGKYQPGDEITLSCARQPMSSTKSEFFEVKIVLMADNGETQN